MRHIVSKLLGISEKSYYRWKKDRKVFKLLSEYFTKEDLEEFLESGKIQKQELIKDKTEEDIKNLLLNQQNLKIKDNTNKKLQEIEELKKGLKYDTNFVQIIR